MITTRDDILDGIAAELNDTPQYLDFPVKARERQGQIWVVTVDLSSQRSKGLDESLEGASAWWLGPPKGAADVLSVIPENEQINLRFASCPPPDIGKLIRIYIPRYLEALQTCWEAQGWAEKCIEWLEDIHRINSYDSKTVPNTRPFKWLRPRQADAFKLPGWNSSFLWGPPGTGKTTTLGAMLAQYLLDFPSSRVLLLSTTNLAVDQALISVDKSLENHSSLVTARAVRSKCFRVGNHFVASQYEARQHLIPIKDETLIERLAKLEAQRPDPEKVEAYALWKGKVESIRAQIRNQSARVLDDARLAAMTTTRAVFTFEDLYQRNPYDLIVFDEASQVGLAHALALAPLGKHALFAGDPKQLAPIVRSEDEMARRWLGNSMFSRMNKSSPSTCLLNEQSRMAESICNLVSHVFYDGELTVAADCKGQKQWYAERRLNNSPPLYERSIHVELIDENGTWSHRYHGPIRYASAVYLTDLIQKLCTELDAANITVLCPFRAQRALIKSMLKREGLRKVKVSTVHRAQGSECHTIIFDPTDGSNAFMTTEDAGRLVNVALSRAQARIVLLLSPGDRENPLFAQIFNAISHADQVNQARPISDYAFRPDFPHCALDQPLRIKNKVGKIIEILEHGRSFNFMCFTSGRISKYVTEAVVKSTPAPERINSESLLSTETVLAPLTLQSDIKSQPANKPPTRGAGARNTSSPRTGSTTEPTTQKKLDDKAIRLIKKVSRITGASVDTIQRIVEVKKEALSNSNKANNKALRPLRPKPASIVEERTKPKSKYQYPIGTRLKGIVKSIGREQATIQFGSDSFGTLELDGINLSQGDIYYGALVKVEILTDAQVPKLRLILKSKSR